MLNKTPRIVKALTLTALVPVILLMSGCDEDVVYKKAVGELNAKAKALSANGDYEGAIGRLEASLDLLPDDVATRYNLAIAYQAADKHEKSLMMFDHLLEEKVHIDNGKSIEATVYKAKGIVLESMGDEIMAKVDLIKLNEEEPDPCFKEEGDVEEMEKNSVAFYQNAIESYEKALSSSGLNQKEMVENQVKQLENRIERIELGEKASEEAQKQL